VSSGPNYLPLDEELAIEDGEVTRADVRLAQWFDPKTEGYYCGDNHVHTRHDATGEVKSDRQYAALQARAGGLDFLTEAGSSLGDDRAGKLSRPGFLFSSSPELAVGAFVGHFNTPGAQPTWEGTSPLPARELVEAAHADGGAVIYTHPLAPPQQLHWMGATELLSDAVLRCCADTVDVRSEAEKYLWFAALNLGNRLGVSGSTDSCLERLRTSSPGDYRVYVQADSLDYPSICEGIRQSRTFASNGGPLFAFLRVDGRPPGSEVRAAPESRYRAEINVVSWRPLSSVALIRRGKEAHRFEPAGNRSFSAVHEFEETGTAWYVLRAEDEQGNWAMTSPIYFTPAATEPPPAATMALLEIGNFTGYDELRKEFFAHVIATVSEGPISVVRLLKNDEPICELRPESGDNLSSAGIPCTGVKGEFQEGWVWWPSPEKAQHFQMDAPVVESGWYQVEVLTVGGDSFRSHALFFDASHPKSRQLSSAVLSGDGNRFALVGYGEDKPLEEVGPPFQRNVWWYPGNQYWRIKVILDGRTAFERSAENTEIAALFRPFDT